MFRIYGLFFLIDLVLVVTALISCLSADEGEIQALPRIAWVFIILLFSPVGPIAWFVAGRPPRAIRMSNGEKWRPGSGFPEDGRPRARSTAPDDDPEFLRGLAKSNRDDEALLKNWEADLRRREDELRKRDEGPAE